MIYHDSYGSKSSEELEKWNMICLLIGHLDILRSIISPFLFLDGRFVKLWFVGIYSIDFWRKSLLFAIVKYFPFICILIIAKTDNRGLIVAKCFEFIVFISEYDKIRDFCFP
jgi:hypothetical protein